MSVFIVCHHMRPWMYYFCFQSASAELEKCRDPDMWMIELQLDPSTQEFVERSWCWYWDVDVGRVVRD